MLLQNATHNLFGLCLYSFTITIKPLRIVLYFLSFNSLTRVYWEKTSMTYNKYLAPKFLEYNDPISAKSAA